MTNEKGPQLNINIENGKIVTPEITSPEKNTEIFVKIPSLEKGTDSLTHNSDDNNQAHTSSVNIEKETTNRALFLDGETSEGDTWNALIDYKIKNPGAEIPKI